MTTPLNDSDSRQDRIAEDYLLLVERALTGIPESQRVELLSDLREHIAAERESLDAPSEAAVREIIDRLGDPETIATAARLDAYPVGDPRGPIASGSTPPSPSSLLPGTAAGSAEQGTIPGRWSGPGKGRRPGTVAWVAIAVGVVLMLCLLGTTAFLEGGSTSEPAGPRPEVTAPGAITEVPGTPLPTFTEVPGTPLPTDTTLPR